MWLFTFIFFYLSSITIPTSYFRPQEKPSSDIIGLGLRHCYSLCFYLALRGFSCLIGAKVTAILKNTPQENITLIQVRTFRWLRIRKSVDRETNIGAVFEKYCLLQFRICKRINCVLLENLYCKTITFPHNLRNGEYYFSTIKFLSTWRKPAGYQNNFNTYLFTFLVTYFIG